MNDLLLPLDDPPQAEFVVGRPVDRILFGVALETDNAAADQVRNGIHGSVGRSVIEQVDADPLLDQVEETRMNDVDLVVGGDDRGDTGKRGHRRIKG